MNVPNATIQSRDLELLDFLDSMQTILNNGLYEIRMFDSAPTFVNEAGENGFLVSGSTVDWYLSTGSAWYSFRLNSTAGFVTIGTLSVSGLVTVGTLSASGSLIAVGSSTFGGIFITDNRNVTLGTGTGTTFATGTNQKLAFYNSTPVVQQAGLTAVVGTVTFSEPTTPDYAMAAMVSAGFGFSTLNEAHSILKVIANLQTRVAEISTRLTTYGLLSA